VVRVLTQQFHSEVASEREAHHRHRPVEVFDDGTHVLGLPAVVHTARVLAGACTPQIDASHGETRLEKSGGEVAHVVGLRAAAEAVDDEHERLVGVTFVHQHCEPIAGAVRHVHEDEFGFRQANTWRQQSAARGLQMRVAHPAARNVDIHRAQASVHRPPPGNPREASPAPAATCAAAAQAISLHRVQTIG
jgi:hypothetical protein